MTAARPALPETPTPAALAAAFAAPVAWLQMLARFQLETVRTLVEVQARHWPVAANVATSRVAAGHSSAAPADAPKDTVAAAPPTLPAAAPDAEDRGDRAGSGTPTAGDDLSAEMDVEFVA